MNLRLGRGRSWNLRLGRGRSGFEDGWLLVHFRFLQLFVIFRRF